MQILKSEIKSQAIKFTAQENGRVVGWAYLYIIQNDRHDEPYGFLENVYVEQEYRKQGIGKQLVHRAIDEAEQQGCYKILGTSRHTSVAAHKFYEKLGFRNHGLEFRMDLKDSKPKQED